MKRFGGLSTAALLAVAVVVTFLGGTSVIARAGERSDQSRQQERIEAVTQLAAGIETWFSDADATLRSIGRRLEPWGGSPSQVAEASRSLTTALAGHRLIDHGAVLADTSGRVLGGTPDHADLFAHPRPYLRVPGGAGPAVTDVIVEPLEHLQTVVIQVPLHGADGSVRGLLAGYSAVPGGSLAGRISALVAAAGDGTVVVSPGGVVLRKATEAAGAIERAGDDLSPPAAQAASGPGLRRYEGEGGSERAAVFAPLPAGWSVVRPVDPHSLTAARDGVLAAATPVFAGSLLLAWAVMVFADLRRRRATARSLEQARSFLAVAGHELRTPLTMVRGFSDTLGRRWDRLNVAAQQDALSTLARQSQTLEQVLTRVLLASQVDAGVVPEVAGPPVDVGEVVSRVARHFEEVSPLHDFVVESEPGLEVAIDAKILEHVLANVIENAVKFSPAGGPVGLRVAATRRTVQVVVEDEGIGLPGKTADLFRRFGQREAVATRTYEEGGLGLGLFIVKSLTELAGGRVHAESRRPRGARFVLEFPRCRVKKAGSRPRTTPLRAAAKEPVASR